MTQIEILQEPKKLSTAERLAIAEIVEPKSKFRYFPGFQLAASNSALILRAKE